MLGSPSRKSLAQKATTKIASFPEEFLRLVENMQFRNPETGNNVKFVSLPQAEQTRIYTKYQAIQQQKANKAKKPKRPTFGKARDAAYGALEEAGWKLNKNLKTPKAERDIDGDRVILHFRPQAVWMEVKGKTPARSLHTDIRDIDPKKWVESLAQEAKDALALEERMKSAKLENQIIWVRRNQPHKTLRKAFAELISPPGEEVPFSPVEVKRLSADRLRELGRSLMVAGTRPPRQQMISIAVTLDGLLEHLATLGEQDPSLNSLYHRILLKMRGQILGQ